MRFLERTLRWLGCLDKTERLVRVTRWLPSISVEVCWPTMLVDGPSFRRRVAPVWHNGNWVLLCEKRTARAEGEG